MNKLNVDKVPLDLVASHLSDMNETLSYLNNKVGYLEKEVSNLKRGTEADNFIYWKYPYDFFEN